MSMAYMDGMAHYDQRATIQLKWTIGDAEVSNTGREGPGISVTTGSLAKTLDYSSSWVTGFAVRFNTTDGWGGEGRLYQIFHAGQSILSNVEVESDGTITLKANNVVMANSGNGPMGSSFSLHPQTWYYIEVKTIFSSIDNISTGQPDVGVQMVCRVNGNVVCEGGPTDSLVQISGLLLNFPKGNSHQFFAGGIITGNTVFSDIYIANINGTGSVNDFAGDIKLGALYPMADVQTDWTTFPADAPSSFSCVNQQFPDGGDSTYIASFVPGQQDNFQFQQINPFAGAIVAVHYGVFARKDDEGTRAFQLTCNGVNVGDVFYPGDTYVYYFVCMDVDQSGSLWTQDSFNGSTFGVNLIQ